MNSTLNEPMPTPKVTWKASSAEEDESVIDEKEKAGSLDVVAESEESKIDESEKAGSFDQPAEG